ncbi:MAG: HEAT repeat domain-containing protein [Deltaproteobacteria bacterium]|nr:HEAT repeat domain-containing protein [Deltaproteobacteria bacterium]
MAEPNPLSLAQLREIVKDPMELAKGTAFFDEGRLKGYARYEDRIYAEAEGSGQAPYRAQIHFADQKIVGRCTCMAARSRPFCKHAAALLVAWSRAPEGFVVGTTPPPGAVTDGKKKQVKRGKSDDAGLMKSGIEQLGTLVRELAVAGIGPSDPERIAQVRGLGANLREHKLRRLSARTLELADRLDQAGEPDLVAHAEILADLLLTTKKLERHLAGEVLEDRYVEELIGKTWRKTDRTPVTGLRLLEYSYRSETTADDFVIRESRFLDLNTGEHYSEKQILPAFLAKRSDPKVSHAGFVLEGVTGSRYPGFSPVRLELSPGGARTPIDHPALGVVLERCWPNVGAALSTYQERRRDPFAPELLPAALRVDTVLADGARLQLVDAQDQGLFLPSDEGLETQLAGALQRGPLLGVLGELGTEGALPTLYPAALILDVSGPSLLPLGGRPNLGPKIDVRRLHPGRKTRWVETARHLGLGGAAVALGELREELAGVLGLGLPSLTPRFVEPIASRLRELGLVKPAEALESASQLADPSERLEGFVKIFQLLSMALVRTAAALPIERSALVPAPSYGSVQVRSPAAPLDPPAIAKAVAEGGLGRYQAALHYARWFEQAKSSTLLEVLHPSWSDGSAAPFVAKAVADFGAPGLEAARRALASPRGRTTWWTGIQVLRQSKDPDAGATLATVEQGHPDPVVRRWAERAKIERVRPATRSPILARTLGALVSAPRAEQRIEALEVLVGLAEPESIAFIRASHAGDISQKVREEAAYALARLADASSVPWFLARLRGRNEDPEAASIAARALGLYGDSRGVEALLSAWTEGWRAPLLADAISAIGEAVLGPLLDRLQEHPELLGKKAVQKWLGELRPAQVAEELARRVEREVTVPPAKAELWLKVSTHAPGAGPQWVPGLLARLQAPGGKAFHSLVQKALGTS